MSKDAVLRKDVPFVGRKKTQNLTSTPPFSPKTAILGPISTVLRNYRPKKALTLEVLRVNSP